MTLPDPKDYGLTPEQVDDAYEIVLDERAKQIVAGIMNVLDADPRVSPRIALVLAAQLQRRYGGT